MTFGEYLINMKVDKSLSIKAYLSREVHLSCICHTSVNLAAIFVHLDRATFPLADIIYL